MKAKGFLLATAAATLLLSGSVTARADEKTAAECTAQGGKIVDAKK
jgi:adenine/guanine phosphoribosyltransferase-like PRPP-binding protein